MGVDGFRFDLATALGRTASGYDPHAAFFQSLMQDPILARAKLIAEPWDIGPGGYQLGHFPGRFQEWNDKFRDSTRRFWLHGGVGRGEFARRFMASSDVFHREHRRPSASVNYICAHDGYTLADMLSYARKHNLENGESNRDGRNGEISANHGVEGPGASSAVTEARKQAARTLLASLMLSQGTPMLRAGDELGQSQRGNNNAYCQDNEISWIDWDTADQDLLIYTARLIALRKEFGALRHDAWFTGRASPGLSPDLQWFAPSGELMSIAAWQDTAAQALAVLIETPKPDASRLWIGLNGDAQATTFHLPAGKWCLELDSAKWHVSPYELQMHIELAPRSIALLRNFTSESH
jgi:glycogen operon protein